MYVDAFLLGVLATVFVELLMFAITVIWYWIKDATRRMNNKRQTRY